MKSAIIIKTTGETEIVDIANDELATLQKAVGGYIEAVALNDNLTMWLNEEGKVEGLPHNPLAQHFFDLRFGTGVDYIVGNAVFTGGADENGETMGLENDTISRLVETYTV